MGPGARYRACIVFLAEPGHVWGAHDYRYCPGSLRLDPAARKGAGRRVEDHILIEHVLRRSAAAKRVDKVVVVTTNRPEDNRLEKFIRQSLGFEVFRGSTDDVLDRFFRCAAPYSPELIVRITADDPLKDPEIIDRAVNNSSRR